MSTRTFLLVLLRDSAVSKPCVKLRCKNYFDIHRIVTNDWHFGEKDQTVTKSWQIQCYIYAIMKHKHTWCNIKLPVLHQNISDDLRHPDWRTWTELNVSHYQTLNPPWTFVDILPFIVKFGLGPSLTLLLPLRRCLLSSVITRSHTHSWLHFRQRLFQVQGIVLETNARE